jgi:serine/threonine protein kinase
MAEHVGQRFGSYTLTRLLGKGGFAEVYLGEHVYLKSLAAIKVLLTSLETDETDRFLTEARTLSALKHPHIVRILDFGLEGDIPFLVMEYAPNGTMQQRHPRGVALAPEIVVPYVRQIASALQYAHDQKLIHRDVKPGNLLLQEDNDLLLSDFGVATFAQSTHQQSQPGIMGTATYMAPEQIRGKACQASDQYALAVVVYEWLTGDYLFQGSFTETCAQHMYADPRPLCSRVPTLSPAIEQVVMTALAKDPSQRFTSVQAFAAALEDATSLSSAIQEAPAQPEDTIILQEPEMLSPDSPFATEAMVTQPGPTPLAEEHLAQQHTPATQSVSSTILSWATLQVHLPQPLRSLKGLLILLVLLIMVLSGSGWLYYAYAGEHRSGSIQQPVATRQASTLPTQTVPSQPTATPRGVPSVTPTSHLSLVDQPTPTSVPQSTPIPTPTAEAMPTPTSAPEPPAQPTPTPVPPAPPPPPTPTPKPVCPPTIQSGSTGTWVKTLQQDLNSRGVRDQNGKALTVDGDFGPLTQYAVKSWQQKAKIGVDGIVGPQTWHSLGHC